nr:MAG TPA: hypothetical protein [Bacteriophage sp.]
MFNFFLTAFIILGCLFIRTVVKLWLRANMKSG